MRRLGGRIILVILALLGLVNLIFFVLSSYSGPVIGLIMAAGAAIHWWRKRDVTFILVIALIWLFLHIFELIVLGRSSYPVFLHLNVLLSIPLLYCSIKIYFSMKKK
jgi:hypothetical protein